MNQYDYLTIGVIGVIALTLFAVLNLAVGSTNPINPVNTTGQVTQLWLNSDGTISSFEISGSTNVAGARDCIIPQSIQIGSIVHYYRDNLLSGCTITVIHQ